MILPSHTYPIPGGSGCIQTIFIVWLEIPPLPPILSFNFLQTSRKHTCTFKGWRCYFTLCWEYQGNRRAMPRQRGLKILPCYFNIALTCTPHLVAAVAWWLEIPPLPPILSFNFLQLQEKIHTCTFKGWRCYFTLCWEFQGNRRAMPRQRGLKMSPCYFNIALTCTPHLVAMVAFESFSSYDRKSHCCHQF